MFDQNTTVSTVKAWDPLIRVFHWSLVLFILVAFMSGDDWVNVHVLAGYAIAGLTGFRLLWGLLGTRNARFSSFVKSPSVVMAYLREMRELRPSHYLGHNPVAAVMVILLLSCIVLVSFSGMVIIAGDGHGPLAGTLFASWSGDWISGIHEALANFTLLLIVAHVAGVIFSSLLEGENLAKAMVTGRKKLRARWQDFDPRQG
jgi:cytochrome b